MSTRSTATTETTESSGVDTTETTESGGADTTETTESGGTDTTGTTESGTGSGTRQRPPTSDTESDSASETTDADPETAQQPTAEDAEAEERELKASLLPSVFGSGEDTDAVEIDIYVVTGRHGLFRVPERFCRECHMFTRRADAAAEQVDAAVNVRVFSWWTRFLGALRHGGYHPPVMVVDGTRLCQGHDVPTTDEVVDAIEDALDERADD
jgi:hypothetical protein